MSPPLFFLSVFSVVTVWVITSLGLPSSLWTFGLVPFLSIYLFCDHGKLWSAAIQVVRSPVEISGVAMVTLFSILNARFMLWRAWVLVFSLLCLIKTFDSEKKMYMGDTYGEIAKSIVWKVATVFTGISGRMKYKGEWAYCSPYSRKLVNKQIDHYYTLRPNQEAKDDLIILESFEFDFSIESCRVSCTYINTDEDSSRGSGTVYLEGESSSSKTEVSHMVTEKYYTLNPCHVSKLEVSLCYQNETLESYTFYGGRPHAVAEVERVLTILKDEGNLIFSNVHTKVGSRVPRAHARCYEFKEIFELLLNKNFALYEVKMEGRYFCGISGSWSITLHVINIALAVWMNVYQLSQNKPKFSILVSLLSLFALVQLFLAVSQGGFTMKNCVYAMVRLCVAQHTKDVLYQFFQVHAPCLTFCNESYGYPYFSSRSKICMLIEEGGNCGAGLPLLGTRVEFLNLNVGLEQRVTQGFRTFGLRNLRLDMNVSHEGEQEVLVQLNMFRCYTKQFCYSNVFRTKESNIANLIALMTWLVENTFVGVCKEWPKRMLIHAYTFEELFIKLLKHGAKPLMITLSSPTDISVEGH